MRKIIFGNWKMFVDKKESEIFFDTVKKYLVTKDTTNLVLGVAPTHIALSSIESTSNLNLISQNVSEHLEGAYTGEISAKILKSYGISYSLVGHSERRKYFLESNEICNNKIKQLLSNDMKAIYCIGETQVEYQEKRTESVIKDQLKIGLTGVSVTDLKNIVFAYEPAWAIGTGLNASEEIASTIAGFIRNEIKKLYDEKSSREVKILYGGSVNKSNIDSYLKSPNIDGVLVGGASKSAESFIELIEKCL